MAEDTVTTPAAETDEHGIAGKTWKRRGLLAAAWTAVAAIVAKHTTQPVEAGVDGDVVLGAANTTTGITSITCSSGGDNLNGAAALRASCLTGLLGQGRGLEGEGSQFGVYGYTNSQTRNLTAGVYGASNIASGYGVWGSNPTGVGVRGDSANAPGSYGVLGISENVGVYGLIPSTDTGYAVAIYGLNDSQYPGSPSSDIGGFGVYGLSGNGHGVVGATARAGAAALVGATNGVAGAYAGVFYGPVVVSGPFTVVGAKSAAVPHPDGSHRLLYCIESPESWLEDFGEQQLECGQAEVALDPDFAAVVNPEHYQVFLTQYGGHDDLTVAERTPRGFRVEAKETTSAARFGWRVLAKRKDIVGERLAKVTIPPEPILPTPEPISERPTSQLIDTQS